MTFRGTIQKLDKIDYQARRLQDKKNSVIVVRLITAL